MFDFDSNDFEDFDGQSSDITTDQTIDADFTSTGSSTGVYDMRGIEVDFPSTDLYAPSPYDNHLDDASIGQPSFGDLNHHTGSEAVKTLEFHPDNNGHNDEYHSVLHNDSEHHNDPSFKGHSQSEINSHITKAKHDIAAEESNIRHHTSIANSKARMNEGHSFEDSQIRNAQHRLEAARKELYKWQHTKPD